MIIRIVNYNHKHISKYWYPEYPDINMLMVEITKDGFKESYFYNSLEG